MTHSPPIPPGNEPPYPTIEPPHAHLHEQPISKPVDTSTAERVRELAPTLIAGAVVMGAAAAVATVIVRARRKPAANGTAKSAPKQRRATRARLASKTVTAANSRKRTSKPKATRNKAVSAPKARKAATGIRGPRDASHIAMGEDYEVLYWTDKFGVDRDALQHAVDKVGSGAAAVEHELGKS